MELNQKSSDSVVLYLAGKDRFAPSHIELEIGNAECAHVMRMTSPKARELAAELSRVADAADERNAARGFTGEIKL